MSCSVKDVLTQDLRKAVSVNGVTIRHDEISREAQNHPAPTPIAAWTAAARALAVRELLLQEARRSGLEPSRPCRMTKGAPRPTRRPRSAHSSSAKYRRQPRTRPPAGATTSKTCRRFRSADLYEAAHILIAAHPERPDRLRRGACASGRC